MRFRVDADVRPKIPRVQRVALRFRRKIYSEIIRLEKLEKHAKVNEPTVWVSQIVVTKKRSRAFFLSTLSH